MYHSSILLLFSVPFSIMVLKYSKFSTVIFEVHWTTMETPCNTNYHVATINNLHLILSIHCTITERHG